MHDEPAAVRVRCRRIATLVVALALALPCSATAQAGDADAPDERDRWVPALSVFGGFLRLKQRGSLASGDVQGPQAPVSESQSPTKIRPDAAGGSTPVVPLVGGSFELMTPRLFESVGSPRLFAHGDLAASFSEERTLAGEATPDDVTLTSPLPSNITGLFEPVWTGQGSRTISELQPLVASAGVGVAFSVDLWGRRIRIKPSFEWLREEFEVKGVVQRVVQTEGPFLPDSGLPFPQGAPVEEGFDNFRLIQLTDSQDEVFHGLGAGLELEGDAARLGPVVLSVYLSGQGYRFLGDGEVRLSAMNDENETATWTFEQDAWAWRGNVGLRFRWVPE